MKAAAPSLAHLQTLTDDVGIFQHATLDVPNRAHGYCVDDNARALIVACEADSPLAATYLSFLQDAQLPDGWFHGFIGYDRRWQDDRGTCDAVGRAIWGLGFAEARAPRASWRAVASTLRQRAMPRIGDLIYLRAHAYAALGLAHALTSGPADAAEVRAALRSRADAIVAAFNAHRADGWVWCEPLMTYDNARIPEALLRAGRALGDDALASAGLAMLEFYAGVTIEDKVFVPVGNQGWFPQGGVKARFGQQPLEAAALVDAALVAHDLTGDARWREVAGIGHAWFTGANSSGAVMARAGGCCDGIDQSGANPNMGGESTLAYLMSALALTRRGAAVSLRIAR